MRIWISAILVLVSVASRASAETAPVVMGRSDAVEVRVEAMRLSPRYGPTKAADGRQFLVLQTTWRNVIDGDKITPYMVPDLGDQLFLIAGGARVTPLASAVRGRPGTLKTNSFTVSAQPVSGALVFDLPAGDPGDLLLVMIDENNGVIRLPLSGQESSIPDTATRQENEILETVVLGTRELAEPSPAGTKLLAVDVRWASRVKAAKAKTGKLVNIPDWKQTFQLIVDGEFALPVFRAPMESGPASVLPDVYTGGELVFRVPADRKMSRLDLHFSRVTLPGQPKPIRPKTLTFPIQPGEAPAAPKAIQAWEDSFFKVELLHSAAQKLGDSAATVVRLRVTNRAKSWEVLQSYPQFRTRSAEREITADPTLTRDLPLGAADTLLIPPGESRQFEMAYLGAPTQLTYASADPDGGMTVDLAPGGAVVVAPQKNPIGRTHQPEDEKPEAPPAEKSIKPADYPQLPDPASIKAQGLAGVGLKPEQVNTAIDRGADALWQIVKGDFVDPRNLGNTDILAALAMTYSGLHKRNTEFDIAVGKAIDFYRPGGSAMYEAGLMLMLIEAYGNPAHLPLARELAQGVIDSQCIDGSFSYTYKGKHGERKKPAPVTNGPFQITGGESPAEEVAGGVLKRRAEKSTEKGGDNSTTQYAVLGLASAQRMGIAIDPAVWKAAFGVTAKRQSGVDGGWAYHEPETSYGSMTAAGLSSYSIARHFGQEQPEAKALQKAMRWINAHFAVNRHPKSNDQWLYYYLYGVERLGRVLDTEFFGSHEWYPQGARYLVSSQGRDGAWRGKGTEANPIYATSFALLFLTKATPTLDGKKQQAEDGTLVVNGSAPEKPKIYIILDCSGSMLAEMGGKMKIDIARDAVKSIVASLPDNVEVGLRVYGHRKRAIEKDADKDVEELVKLSPLDRASMNAKLDALRARGKTPLAESLSQTAKTLAGVRSTTPVIAILLTDGGEDTRPRGDPVAAAREFANIPGVRLKIVGFDINQDDWTQQLNDMAGASRGTFIAAADAEKLGAGLVAAVKGGPGEFKLANSAGDVVASGAFGQTLRLKPGKYKLTTSVGDQSYAQELHIAPGRSTTLNFSP